ncbi:DUF1549 domain-containing protein, partial [Verrucomicrobia bacterium]|nr:DUF1549 domain-containing protein [Verrucomicrobiota bacterium]
MRIVTIISLLGLGFQAANAAEKVATDVLFARKVLPLFKTKCLACHGEDPKKKLKGDFDMRSRVGLLRGGESEEPSIVLGKPLQSPLYLAITREHEDDWEPMPPKENDKLSAEQVKYIKDWIVDGAPWPNTKQLAKILKQKDPWGEVEGVLIKTSGGLDEGWTSRKYDPKKLWAYQPVKKPKLPEEGHPIDAFIKARSPKDLTSAPRAEATTLIRRVTYNLTGLPPTPQETFAFVDA